MKFVCSICGNLVDNEDVIIDFEDVNGIRLAIKAYCPSCWKKRREKNLKKAEGSFWRRVKK